MEWRPLPTVPGYEWLAGGLLAEKQRIQKSTAQLEELRATADALQPADGHSPTDKSPHLNACIAACEAEAAIAEAVIVFLYAVEMQAKQSREKAKSCSGRDRGG